VDGLERNFMMVSSKMIAPPDGDLFTCQVNFVLVVIAAAEDTVWSVFC
jgi:hypothetical protein